MYYVYSLTDPRSQEVFYIGKGKGNRLHAHEREARKVKDTPKCKTINDIWDAGLEVIKSIIKTFDDEAKAYAYEKSLISKLGKTKLTNQTSGGGGIREPKILDEAEYKDKMYLELAWKLIKLKASNLIPCIRLCGLHEIDDKLIDAWKQIAKTVIERRGKEWAYSVLANR